MAEPSLTRSYSSDPTLWLYTSLSSGSSQIVTATSRLETILKANKIPFKALDVATDEKARMLWGRRAGKRKLPGLVKMGMVVGDIDEIEEWNEYGELKEQLGAEAAPAPMTTILTTTKTPAKTTIAAAPAPAAPPVPSTADANAAASKQSENTPPAPKPASSISFAPDKPKSEQTGAGGVQASMSLAMRQLGQEAAARANKNKSDALAARKAQVTAADKLDNAAPTGLPPPSGETEAADAIAPDTAGADVVSKADNVPETKTKAISQSDGAGDVKDESGTAIKGDVASGSTAVRPESPIAAPGESGSSEPKSQPTTTKSVSEEAEFEAPGSQSATDQSKSKTQESTDEATSTPTTASGADATRPESPLPAAGDDTSRSTTTTSDISTKVEPLPASGATAARPKSPLPETGEETEAKSPSTTSDLPALESSSSLSISSDKFNALPAASTSHRGSNVSTASAEEIKQVEEANKIPEEPEEEEKAAAGASETDHSKLSTEKDQHVKFGGERKGDELDRVKEELSRDRSPARVQNSTATIGSDTNETTSAVASEKKETVKTHEQPAAEPEKATESVYD